MRKFKRFIPRFFRRSSPPVVTQAEFTRIPGAIRHDPLAVVVIPPSNEESTTYEAQQSQRPPSAPNSVSNHPSSANGSVSGALQQASLADDTDQGPSSLRPQGPFQNTSSNSKTAGEGVEIYQQNSAGLSDPRYSGSFQNAKNFSVNQPTMIDRADRVEIYQQNSTVFVNMRLEHVIRGAEFDSSDRDYPPQCHPGTRTRFLNQLRSRIRSATRIIWIRGPAGVGKSAIMQTLAETITPDFTCATLFFSRPNKRDDPKKVFTTLAYALVVANSSYRQYLGERMAIDSGFLDKSIREQFNRLFIIPFIGNRINTEPLPWVVFLDGLDECNGDREQGLIVDLIRESILRYGDSMPFVWVIASRPEAHLAAHFDRVEAQIESFWKLEIPIDSDEATRDVERYLRAEFAKIRQNYPDVVPSHWPSENAFLTLAGASSGLFVFASTSMAYIAEDNPVLRFRHILSLITQHDMNSNNEYPVPRKNPFQMLDSLYETIMSDIPAEFLPTTKTILGFRLLGNPVDRLDFRTASRDDSLLMICNILGLEQHMAYAALRRLNSVLTFPSQDNAHNGTVKFLHASFSDFLKDGSRSRSYHIDLNQELKKIWWGYVRIIRQSISSPGNIILSWEREVVEGGTDLRGQLLERAEDRWLQMLQLYCHAGCASSPCKNAGNYQFSPDTTEFIEAFQDIRLVLIRPTSPDVSKFYIWLSNHAPQDLRQKMILKEFGVTRLNESEADNMFNGFSAQQWGYYLYLDHVIELSALGLTGLDRSRWESIKQIVRNKDDESLGRLKFDWTILGHLLRGIHPFVGRELRNIKISVIGVHASDYFAFIAPTDLSDSYGSENAKKGVSYLIIPYSPVSVHGSDLKTL